MDGIFDGTTLPEVEFSLTGSGTEGWRPVHVHAREGLSTLYEVTVVLAHPVSTGASGARAMLAQSLVLEVHRGSVTRRLCGFARRVEDLGSTGGYHFACATLVPALWRLSQRTDCRIFQDLNVVEIVREVLRDAGAYQGDGGLWVGTALEALAPREYCVQYNESDLDFVRRLLEDEGVPFYFRHAGEVETLVLAEDGHAWTPVPTMDGVAAIPIRDAGVGTAAVESIQWFDVRVRDHATGATLRDYDFTHPSAEAGMTMRAPTGAPGPRDVYEFRGTYTLGEYDDVGQTYGPHEGGRFARARYEELAREAVIGCGRSVVTGVAPGLRFEVTDHESTDLPRSWLVTEVEQQGVAWSDIPDDVRTSEHVKAILRSVGAEFPGELARPEAQARYWNRFTCIPAATPYRPARTTSRPRIYGPQTARVVAEPGSDEEICVDFHGRILVRFHWVREGRRVPSQREKRLSCRMRVAQNWAGSGWGFMFIPRVGMEVVVHFLEGDPDRPLVTGCVYNGENHASYALPAERTRSTIRTSSSPRDGGFNELRFEDLKGAEEVYIHAQRDMKRVVNHDDSLEVQHDRTKFVAHDEWVTTEGDRATRIGGNDSVVVDGDDLVEVHGSTGLTVFADRHVRVTAGEGIDLICGASRLRMRPDNITLTSGGASIEMRAAEGTIAVTANREVKVHGDDVVDIKGGLVKINT